MSRRARSPAARTSRSAPAPSFDEVNIDRTAQTIWRQDASGRLVSTIPAAANLRLAAPASRWWAEVQSIFLPAGYPESVRPEYIRFQAFDTLQAACSYLRSILTTSAILKASGVGEDKASPMAAAITWVLRDGVGMFGSLVFSYLVGASFDVHVKEWRLFADLINDVGLTLDMFAPLVGGGTPFAIVAAVGAACKTICGMVAGATRASITAHFAMRSNLADVSAKENAQETGITLLGLLGGSLLAQKLGDSARTAWLAFGVLTALHVWANVLGVGCLTFSFLNPQRANLVCTRWWATWQHSSESARKGLARRAGETSGAAELSPALIARAERIWRPLLLWRRGPRLGVSLGQLLDTSAADGGASQLRDLQAIFRSSGYLLRLDPSGVAHVALRDGADGGTALRALLHAATLRRGSFGIAPERRRQEWARTLNRTFLPDLDLLATRPARPPESGRGLGEEERLALTESLALTDACWEAFAATLDGCGWDEAALRVEHCCGPMRVKITSE